MTLESAPPNGGAVITAAEVTRTCGEGEAAVHALRGVSLEIERHRLTAVIAGVLAAIVPARRASKLNVLRALQYE